MSARSRDPGGAAEVGERCPPLFVHTSNAPLTLDAFDGRVVVLAFIETWTDSAPEIIAAIRAELRRLGAGLVLLSSTGVFLFRPGEGGGTMPGEVAETLIPGGREPAEARMRDTGEIASARITFGLDRPSQTAIFVVDGERVVRFARRFPQHDPADLGAIRDVLASAGRALVHGMEKPRGSRRDILVTSLVAAFVVGFLESCKEMTSNA